MAELEAITKPDPNLPEAESRQFGWRNALEVGKSIRLGQSAADSDWTVSDPLVSKFHATLVWNGEKLEVTQRSAQPPAYPREPVNSIWYNGAKVKTCSVRVKEFFVIGNTRFTLHPEGETAPSSPVDATLVQHQQDFTRAQLENIPFANPAAALKALEQVPNVLRVAQDDRTLLRQMLKVVMDALPRVDAAGIVGIPPDCAPGELKIALIEHHARPTASTVFGPSGFVPSRKLAHQSIKDRKSSLHLWLTDPKDLDSRPGAGDMTLGVLHQQNLTPWAICTPFLDGSKSALYLTGRVTGQLMGKDPKTIKDLTEYQKIAELMVGLLETTRRTHRLSRQNALIKKSWPRPTWRYLEDPDQLEKLLRPRETDVTVLFCDLRGSSLFAEQGADELVRAWRGVASALDDMSQAITNGDGVVAGFQGDAVMGFWGWPEPQAIQLEQAAKAALRIQDVFTGFLAELKCGLGLAHGRGVAGRLGANDLAKVDVYGPVVNLAARLENMTKSFGVGILVNEAIAAHLASIDPGGQRFRTRLLGTVKPRGMKKTFQVSELMHGDAEKASEGFLALWGEAVEWFTAGEWDRAYGRLTDYFDDDPAAKCLKKVMDRTKRCPPPDWDGSFTPPAAVEE